LPIDTISGWEFKIGNQQLAIGNWQSAICECL